MYKFLQTSLRASVVALTAIPYFFLVTFSWLIVRAWMAFGALPRMSANDPWALENRAQVDWASAFFPYSSHLLITSVLLMGMFASLIGYAVVFILLPQKRWILMHRIWLGGLAASVFVVVVEQGRFLVWFLD
jgi:hypothetical protein